MPRSGKLIHYRVNPERVLAVCDFCGERWMATQSSLARSHRHYHGRACARLGRMLDLLLDGGEMRPLSSPSRVKVTE
jgi:hypothetical protein